MSGRLAFVVAALAIGNAAQTKNTSMQDANVGQSRKADQILSKGFPQADPQTEFVCSCRARRAPSTIPAFRATINDVAATVNGKPAIKNLKSPLDPKNRDQVSKNRRTAIVTWNMKGKADVAKRRSTGSRPRSPRSATGTRRPTSARPARSAPARHSTRCSQTI